MEFALVAPRAMGQPLDRLDGPDKVRGVAPYAYEQPVARPAYVFPVLATIAVGRVTGMDTSAAEAAPGVLGVLTHHNAPRLVPCDLGELLVLQSDHVSFRGQIVAAVIAETIETARHAAGLVRVEYEARAHDVDLRADRDDLVTPPDRLPQYPMNTAVGDVDAGMASAAVPLEVTYRTPREHHVAMEPHATVATWTDDGLTLHVSTQGVHGTRAVMADLFGLDRQRVRVISPYVGGAFGSKVTPRADMVITAMAARQLAGRPVKFTLTRQQVFSQAGYRPPTIQRIRLGADTDGRLVAIDHQSVEASSKIQMFAEQATRATPAMYAAVNRRTRQRLARLDLSTPSIMRAPGEASGMVALESAMDEMAIACGMDPVEFRIRNEPSVNPTTGQPFSSRNLVRCLREGARRFGWEHRDPMVRARREAGWLVGTGVAAATYPVLALPGSMAVVRAEPQGTYTVAIGAADIGTGAWTALTQIAADALEVDVDRVDVRIADTRYPMASNAGGSTGIHCWGSAIVAAVNELRGTLSAHGGAVPPDGLEASAPMPDNANLREFSMHSFGAHFVEVRVHEDTGEVRVPRMLGVFAAGRIVNPKLGGSQLLGAMVMGLSMALFEEAICDPRFGHVVTQDLATYHVASNADVGALEVHWLDEEDRYVNAMGTKGIGELGIVGVPAAIANAVYHATGIRVRDLPITPDKLLF